ncbi:type VI secretion system tip protein VgrG [Parasulfuritortus cantonensis]|uniref:Type VI secretion system tip protein VgrG n=1 Tax=Parasulfuritortus cantonensis TaxID=2528202 RepID=A0A4R1BRN4_9PROT|nr:type VI secretion system tip protein TssI/VgrG [Parasulfuritortus cantonensis]TCJ20404.1 type VI secretion system tip protein VgrG [Parasulfuritortus cantonensis]
MPHMLEIATPLTDGFTVRGVSGREELGRLSEYQVDLISKNGNITAKDILGKNVTLKIAPEGSTARFINGYVTRFALFGQLSTTGYDAEEGYSYAMTVRPWAWFLSRSSTCQIFQNMDVPAIIKQVMDRTPYAEISSYEVNLNGSYAPWEYCVQYRESDFNFISRLMEQEGIYYYFKHEDGKHVMVLVDDLGSHEANRLGKALVYNATPVEGVSGDYYITRWDSTVAIQPGRYAVDDFDFTKPRADLGKAKDVTREHDMSGFEMFDYPGEYVEGSDGEHYAQVRIHELQCQYEICRGATRFHGLDVGALFTLEEHPVGAQNREYLVTSSNFQAVDATTSSGGSPLDFRCSFNAMPKGEVSFRPERMTPKPIVQGPQTAIVVGPDGDEIHTDEYARVKVQFHWDRYGKSDEDSSCWIRVSQVWAGKAWGGLALPRIGQEVIVGFLEGDPDQPIITGRVYNADQPPPYALPDRNTVTTLVSRSSPDGTAENYNELRFEDKKGDEHIFIQAEKDYLTLVKNDRVEWTKNEYHLKIDQKRFEETGGDRHDKSKGDFNSEVTGELSLKVDQNHQHEVGQGYNLKAGQAIHLKAGTTLVIEAGTSMSLKVGGSFVNIGPSGVDISGPMVKINSGGSAGSGAGATPKAPDPPRELEDIYSDKQSELPERVPPQAVKYSSQAAAFKDASASGTPFCEVCAGL